VLLRNAASAGAPTSVSSSTVQAACLLAAGQAAAVSPPIAALTEGVVKAMFLGKVKALSAVVLAASLLGAGAALPPWLGAAEAPAEAGKGERASPRKAGELDAADRDAAEKRKALAEEAVQEVAKEDPPDDSAVLRAMPKAKRGVPYIYEEFRDNVQIVTERLVGPAQLHHCRWRCTVYYDETIESGYPFPFKCVRPRAQVVYIDKDRV
jgi:hypothetical protein